MSRLSERLRELSESRGLTQAQIADRASDLGFSLGKGAISRYFNGKHGENPSNGTLTAFARVLDVPVSDLKDAAAFTGREPFSPDPSSDRLTAPQRNAVNEIIRLLADGNTGRGDGNADDAGGPTPMKSAEGNSAISEDDGLGSFGGRARGDLDHESKNDGSEDNVHELFTPPPPASETAAKHGKNTGRSIRRKQDEDAERPDPDPSED